MEYKYEGNTNDCSVTYFRTRYGPNFFLVYYKNAAKIRYTPKEVGRVFGIAKFTPFVNSVREWAKTMVSQYEKGSSESSLDDDHDDQVSTTKMII